MELQELVESSKKEFIKRFNIDFSIGSAKKKALGAALQRNPIYSGDYNQNIRFLLKETIYAFLDEMALKYSVLRTEEEYEEDILALEKRLNDVIKSGINQLKISHTQKVLSVFLKHLWCLGKIPIPPQCPVDRNTLLLLYPTNTPAWTKIDSISEYKNYIKEIKSHIAISRFKSFSIAEWELVAFQNVIDKK